jgi:hypothetical protein
MTCSDQQLRCPAQMPDARCQMPDARCQMPDAMQDRAADVALANLPPFDPGWLIQAMQILLLCGL